MKKQTKEERLKDSIKKGVALLQEEKGYSQSSLVKKMKTLGCLVSAPSLSNILTDKDVGLSTLQTASKGIREIVLRELGMTYHDESGAYRNVAKIEGKLYVIPEEKEQESGHPGVILHPEGRLSIRQKTDFIISAQKEVIEVGVRLKTFSEYFVSRNETEYKTHILNLLRKGVSIKGYLLDPHSNEASLYFNDRAKVEPSEYNALVEARIVLERLKNLVQEIGRMQLHGSLEIYLYKHIPYNHFLAVDTGEPGGKMLVSHYMYGIRRAECPVWEFSKSTQPTLFRKYAASLQSYLRDAKRLS